MKLDTLQIVGGSLGLNSQWLCLLHAFHFGTLLQRALWSKLSERQHGEEGEREGERGGRKNPSSLKYRHSAAFTRLSPLSPPSSCWKKGFTFQTRLYSLPAAFFLPDCVDISIQCFFHGILFLIFFCWVSTMKRTLPDVLLMYRGPDHAPTHAEASDPSSFHHSLIQQMIGGKCTDIFSV